MKEIIQIQVGECGNQLGADFLNMLCLEHGIDKTGVYQGVNPTIQLEKAPVYYQEESNGRLVPRSIFIGLKQATFNSIRYGEYRGILKDNFVLSNMDSSGNWAKGHSIGNEMMDVVMDIVRKEAELCDDVQGFQVSHSLGGGIGSGMTSCLISNIKEEFPEQKIFAFSVFPSEKKIYDCVAHHNALQIPNIMLSLDNLVTNVDACLILDNEAIHSMCTDTLKIMHPNYQDLNKIISAIMSGVTTTFRFPGPDQVNSTDLHTLRSLVPLPKIPFLMSGFAPITPSDLTVRDLTRQLWDPKNVVCTADATRGRCLKALAVYRGMMNSEEIDEAMVNLQDKHSSDFLEWIPKGVSSTFCPIPVAGFNRASTSIFSSTAVQSVFTKVNEKFDTMSHKRDRVHWYMSEGMDEPEFTDPKQCMSDILYAYQQLEVVNQENEDDNLYRD